MPFSLPTIDVGKAVGWHIIHDFRAIYTCARVPEAPVPRKEEPTTPYPVAVYFCHGSALSILPSATTQARYPVHRVFHARRPVRIPGTPMGFSPSRWAFDRLTHMVFEVQCDFCRAHFDDLFVLTTRDSMDENLPALDKALARGPSSKPTSSFYHNVRSVRMRSRVSATTPVVTGSARIQTRFGASKDSHAAHQARTSIVPWYVCVRAQVMRRLRLAVYSAH